MKKTDKLALADDVAQKSSKEQQNSKYLDFELLTPELMISMLEVLPDAVGVWDAEDRLLTFNTEFKEMMLAFPRFEIGRSYFEIMVDFAETGVVKEAIGREEEWARLKTNARNDELGETHVYQTHDGRWLSRTDQKLANGNIVSLRRDVTEEKLKEQRLKDKSDLLELTSAAMKDLSTAVLVRDKDLKYCIANDQFGIMFGKPVEEIIGKTAAELFGEVASVDFDAKNLKTIQTGEAYSQEEVLEFPDGRRITSLTEVKRIIGDDGEPYACITITDVSEIRNREKALAVKTAELALSSAALSNMSSAVLIKDKNMQYRLVNKQFCEILGKQEIDLIGKTTAECLGENRARKYDERELSVIETGNQIEFEETFVGPDGNNLSAITSITRITDPVGNHYACVAVKDITELKAREEKLQKFANEIDLHRQKMENFAETSADWFWETDSDLRFTFFSEGVKDAVGFVPSDLIGKTRRDLWRDVDLTEEQSKHLQTMDERQAIKDYIYQTTNPKGEVVWISVSGSPSFDSERNFTGYYGSGRNVTAVVESQMALKKAQMAAHDADRAKSEFLANMSHEIRTPMNGVMGMAELLTKTELNAKQKMFTDVIVKSGASLLTIINDILDFSKLEAGQMELDLAPFSLAEAIEDVATLVSSRVAEKDLELIVRVDPQLPDIMIGDVGRIRQIITNLMGNAVKFTEVGHVYVNVRNISDAGQPESKMRLRFEVEDTGIGIPEAKSKSVFEKFSQADTSASRKHEGTGLGLTICSSLVEIMGGEIGVFSEEGKGSTFWFEVEMPAHETQTKRQRVPMDVTGARILIVDDNAVNRSILSEQMTAWKFDSAAAVDGFEALAVMRAAIEHNVNIDCVVLDYHMPGMNGGDVVREMRADKALANVPVIMLTSVDQTEDGKVFSSLGIQAHMTKPARSSFLLENIIAILEQNNFEQKPTLRKIEPSVSVDIPDVPVSRLGEGDNQTSEVNEGEVNLAQSHVKEDVHQVDILVCEDNQVNQIVFTQILESIGYSYEIASNGKLGVELALKYNPKVILMDVSMPEMNGLEATAAIRESEREHGAHTPIIGVTAHAIKGDMEKCIEAGMDDYLSKPISPDALEGKINQWMDTVRKRSQA
ncbi:MAG: response regulator [Salaquimonas sp.]